MAKSNRRKSKKKTTRSSAKKTARKSSARKKTRKKAASGAKKRASAKSPRRPKKAASPRRRTAARAGRTAVPAAPSDDLRIGITFPAPGGAAGPVRFGARLNTTNVADFLPEEPAVGRALAHLESLGFGVTARGRLTASVRGKRADFERVFGTRVSKFRVAEEFAGNCRARSFYYPAPGAPWSPDPQLTALIDDAYIQWPHVYLNQRFPVPPPSPLAPRVAYHHLRVPHDVNLLLNVPRVHREGTTGLGVKVAMIDSGFAHGHPHFQECGYRSTTVLAPGATHVERDGNGHGTGESANLLGIAPDVTFVGIKLDNENDPRQGASILEGFQEALKHNPHVISVSLGFDLCPANPITGRRTSNHHLTTLPNSLIPLEAEIEAAVASGIVVVFSAGNGHVAFPGMMPDVISAGGVFVDPDGAMVASDYASAFDSKIYPGRHVPDFCGLVGMVSNGASYIMLPVDPGGELDRLDDETATDDGWGVFSGTSAAAPQLAGVCALLLQKNPSLTPEDVKSVLRSATRDVVNGRASAASNENRGGMPAGVGQDGATGSGLVDTFAAWKQV